LGTNLASIIDELVLFIKNYSSSTVAEVNARLEFLFMASMAGQERNGEKLPDLIEAGGLGIL
jgi:hypothetical protein